MKLKTYLFFVLFAFSALSCSKSHSSNPSACTSGEEAYVVDMNGLDGCGFNLKLAAFGQVLEPTNLVDYPSYKFHNKKVLVEYEEVQNMPSICMVGPVVRILCISEPKN